MVGFRLRRVLARASAVGVAAAMWMTVAATQPEVQVVDEAMVARAAAANAAAAPAPETQAAPEVPPAPKPPKPKLEAQREWFAHLIEGQGLAPEVEQMLIEDFATMSDETRAYLIRQYRDGVR
jgi:hypothetical protein